MTANKRTNIALAVFGAVAAGVIGYFVWTYLAPPSPVAIPENAVSTDVKTGVVNDGKFRGLEPYAALPIVPTNVGRPDPFAPFLIENKNAGENVNANNQ